MGSDFNSTLEKRLWRLEQDNRFLATKLTQMSKDVSALQQGMAQLWGVAGGQGSGGSTGGVFYGTATSAIAAKAGTTASSGTATITDLDKNGNISGARSITCFNGTSVQVASGDELVIERNPTGVYVITNRICP